MRAYRGHTEGKNFVWKIYCYFPQKIMASSLSTLRAEYNWRAISRTLSSNLKLPLISEEIFNLSNLRVLPAKSKCKMPSDFWWKRQVFFHWWFFFSFFFHLNINSEDYFFLTSNNEAIYSKFMPNFCQTDIHCIDKIATVSLPKLIFGQKSYFFRTIFEIPQPNWPEHRCEV